MTDVTSATYDSLITISDTMSNRSFYSYTLNSTTPAFEQGVFCEVGVDELPGLPKLMVSSLFSNSISLQFAEPVSGDIPLSLMDVNGRELLSDIFPEGTSQMQIQTGSIPSGIYLLHIGNHYQALGIKVIKP
jgi:hypothetical protein